jgi:RNA polymerase sigma factor (sigma-70 family)
MTHGHVPVPPRSPPDPPAVTRQQRLASLLGAARAGERDALAGIVAELSPLLWQVARAQGLDRDASSDVVQTTWLHLVRQLDDIRTPAALTGWLVTVTKREAWRIRAAGNQERPAAAEVYAEVRDQAPTPDDRLIEDDRRRALWAAVNRLPARCRELLRIVAFVHRPNYEAVSAALGMPRGSIGPNRGRCLAKLRALLASDPHWSGP